MKPLIIRPYHGLNATIEQWMWDAFGLDYNSDIGGWVLDIYMTEFVQKWTVEHTHAFLAYPSDDADYSVIIFVTNYSNFHAR